MDKGKSAPRVKPTPEQCEELAEAEGRVRAVLENVVDGIITIDEEAIVQTFNPAAERIFGYAAAEVIGQNVKMLMPEPYHDRHDEYVGHYVHTGEARIIGMGREVTGRRKDGSTFPMDLAVSEFRLRGRQMFVGITRDISVRKRAEETFKFLAEASAALSVLVDYESALRRVAHMAVPRFAELVRRGHGPGGRLAPPRGDRPRRCGQARGGAADRRPLRPRFSRRGGPGGSRAHRPLGVDRRRRRQRSAAARPG